MALCRCKEIHSPPKSNKYVVYAYPVGSPDTSSICGNPKCQKPGLLWLDDSESKAYQNGQRIFCGPSNMTKMKADDRGIFKWDQ